MHETRAPLLNLAPDSFRVLLHEPGGALPLLWSARVELVTPGCSVEVRTADGRLSWIPSPGNLDWCRQPGGDRLVDHHGAIEANSA